MEFGCQNQFIVVLLSNSFSFSENDIDLEILSTMTEADFKEVGVTSFGTRRKIVLLMRKANNAPPDGNMNVVCIFMFIYYRPVLAKNEPTTWAYYLGLLLVNYNKK